MESFIRRVFLFTPLCLMGGCATDGPPIAQPHQVPISLVNLQNLPVMRARPLDEVVVIAGGGRLAVVTDGLGRVTGRHPLQGGRTKIVLGGALGSHQVRIEDALGRTLGTAAVRVDTRTGFEEEVPGAHGTGEFADLLDMLHATMKGVKVTRFRGKDHHTFVSWIRDHNHVMKAMKYFYPDLQSGVDLYRDTQRPDGMIWDNHQVEEEVNHWDQRFEKNNFVSRKENLQFRRIPVEADVEYLYVEAMWHAWKATGDDAWLRRSIDSAQRALRYMMTDPIRWSKKYQLVRRGYTIDTWDFQHAEDAARVGGDAMQVDLDRTEFGVMYGDNTGLVASSNRLAEMLDHLGRDKDAEQWRRTARDIKARLDALAWNGRFYTHHVPENPAVERNFGGVDPNQQVSLSNAYSLNRGLALSQRRAIITEYQRIRAALPPGSPGEWYTIYPTYGAGFGGHNGQWHYMNGGVITIVAGELARGAFDSGFEAYGVDILRRVSALARKHDRQLPVTFRGARPDRPMANFTLVSLAMVANTATTWEASAKYRRGKTPLPAWGNLVDNDLPGLPRGRQIMDGVPFEILRDEDNAGRTVVGLSAPGNAGPGHENHGYFGRASVAVGARAKSLYLLHAVTKASDQVGRVVLHYTDRSQHSTPINVGREVAFWWYPTLQGAGRKEDHGDKRAVIAWEGKNASARRVGLTAFGLTNPHPDRAIQRVEFITEPNDAKWLIVGLTLSDQDAGFPGGDLSFGIPANWGAAAVAYALVEGLAGLSDEASRFSRARVAPRWAAAGVDHIVATATYPASEGYVRYRYHRDAAAGVVHLQITGSGEHFDVEALLPGGARAKSVTLDGEPLDFKETQTGDSHHVTATIKGVGVHTLAIALDV